MARPSLFVGEMQAIAQTLTLVGLEPHPVRVEVESRRGIAAFDVVGLAETTVRESRVRVRAALGQLGIELHSYCLTVSLAPADLRKIGSGFDLAIALGTLAAIGAIDASLLTSTALFGELSLSGELRAIRGVLPLLIGARALGVTRAIVPRANAGEAAAVAAADGCRMEVLVANDLASVVAFLKGTGEPLERASAPTGCAPMLAGPVETVDLTEVRGQPGARRALEIAAAGGHDLLMIGPPGAGKTMLARRFTTLLPPLADEEALEATAVHSIAGLIPPYRGLLRHRPFRAPHHSVSDAGLLGGGEPPRPGELSLAHAGILFLDELPEFRRPALEGLRQPLEDGVITISRARSRATFPARPLVLAAMNPCPCGFDGTLPPRCTCSRERVRAYRARISGPIVDRLDLHVALPPVDVSALARNDGPAGESSADVRARVGIARLVQLRRKREGKCSALVNARLSPSDCQKVARLDARGVTLLADAIDRLGLSARAYGKVLRLARTIADLEQKDAITPLHVAEAIQYRLLDRRLEEAA